MIPKILHYVWLGNQDKPESVLKCIETWNKYLPDYQIIEWNEKNFDVENYAYCKEAYENKKYAFVSDVIRLEALKKMGGIYLDTDVEILSDFQNLLKNKSFLGFESIDKIGTAIIGAEKNTSWVGEILDQYMNKKFVNNRGEFDTTTNVEMITEYLFSNWGLELNGESQNLKNQINIYSNDYFYPKNIYTKVINVTDNTVAIHHFEGTWISKNNKRNKKLYSSFVNILGENGARTLKKIIKKIMNR